MAIVRPFNALTYNIDVVGDIASVITPPYDVISPEEQDRFYRSNPYNIIRIELGRESSADSPHDNRYTRAATFLREWRRENVLVRESIPTFSLYRQRFTVGNTPRERLGLVAAVKLEPFEARIVLPHERTLSRPKHDRLELLRATETNISHIFGLYSDKDRVVDGILEEVAESVPPCFAVTVDGVTHELFSIADQGSIHAISRTLEPLQILIADGHHRYETALAYRDEREVRPGGHDGGYGFTMMTLANMESGLVVLPIHRSVRFKHSLDAAELRARLSTTFEVTPVSESIDLSGLLAQDIARNTIGFVDTEGMSLLRLRDDTLLREAFPQASDDLLHLDVNVVQALVFERELGIGPSELEDYVAYPKDEGDARRLVRDGLADAAFILRPVDVHTIHRIAQRLEKMPQKTSFFYPKIWTGLVMRSLDD